MTNQEKFIQIFGVTAWEGMIVFSGLAEQFKEYWTSPYKEDKKEQETTLDEAIKLYSLNEAINLYSHLYS